MNKPTYKKEDEEVEALEGLIEPGDSTVQDALDNLDGWKSHQNDGAESLTYGDY